MGQAGLEDFPSLRDLETSNLFTNNFQATKAARLALLSFNDTKRKQLDILLKMLEHKKSVKLQDLIKESQMQGKSKRLNATQSILSMLSFA